LTSLREEIESFRPPASAGPRKYDLGMGSSVLRVIIAVLSVLIVVLLALLLISPMLV